MRVLGLIGLVLALLVVALLLKQQMHSTGLVPTVPGGVPATAPAAPGAPAGQTVREQSRQFEQQYKQAIDAAMQPRKGGDDQ